MPYQKLKSENYSLLGGMNIKASQYDTQIFECLDIFNMDFFVPGAFMTRPGAGTFILGYSNLVFTGGVTQLPSGPVTSVFEFSNLQGSSSLLFTSNPQSNVANGPTFSSLWQIYSNILYSVTMTTNPSIPIGTTYHTNYVTFNNAVYMSDGNVFYKWTGVSSPIQKYCVPGPTQAPGSTAGTHGFRPKYIYATHTFSYAYIDEFGFIGPISPFAVDSTNFPVGATTNTTSGCMIFSDTLVFYDNVQASTQTMGGFLVPGGYGIGCTLVWGLNGFTFTGQPACVAIFFDSLGPNTQRTLYGYATSLTNIIRAAADVTLNNLYCPGIITSGGHLQFDQNLNITGQDDYGLGAFYSSYSGATNLGLASNNRTLTEPTCINFTLAPQFMEVFQNQLFMGGFSSSPSTVVFSDIAQAESVQPGSNFDVRTNDGDILSGMKSYYYQLFLFKRNSFHVLSGTDPTNFYLQQVSQDYGCISNKAIVTFENTLLFLDKKGICSYNGFAANVISNKVENLFLTMTLSAAFNNAWMVHNKPRNQILCGIPTNGSTLINTVIVFDYLLNSWSYYQGLNICSLGMAFKDLPYQAPFVGTYSGTIGYLSASFTSDFGTAITFGFQSRFISDLGESVEKMYRRLYINQGSAIGATVSWNVLMYQDYQTSVGATVALTGQTFQIRADFGIPAKAMSFRFLNNTTTDKITVFGFTVESRYQRSV